MKGVSFRKSLLNCQFTIGFHCDPESTHFTVGEDVETVKQAPLCNLLLTSASQNSVLSKEQLVDFKPLLKLSKLMHSSFAPQRSVLMIDQEYANSESDEDDDLGDDEHKSEFKDQTAFVSDLENEPDDHELPFDNLDDPWDNQDAEPDASWNDETGLTSVEGLLSHDGLQHKLDFQFDDDYKS